MGTARNPFPVKLVVPMFSPERALFQAATSQLEQLYGPVDYRSRLLPFDHTHYYTPEFGPDLLRMFIAFEGLIDPGSLAEIKLSTNALEQALAQRGNRRINLDPGYVSQSKFVLATTKNHGHRIYLGRGIYAEVTLRYKDKTFQPWEWTYPDYRTADYLEILQEIRQIYVQQLRALKASPSSDIQAASDHSSEDQPAILK